MNSKAIFVGGVPRSGTTLTIKLLGRHRQIASFYEAKLVNDPIFREFPDWLSAAPHEHRLTLINIYQTLCLTRFFYFRMNGVNKILNKAFKIFNRLWIHRFKSSSSWLWRNFFWKEFERTWLSASIQQRSFRMRIPEPEEAYRMGFRGLHPYFIRNDFKKNFHLLNLLQNASSLQEMDKWYGEFWSAVFSEYAARQNKPYWAEKTPDNCNYPFLFHRWFKNLKMIHVIRDGRDVACSAVRRWGGSYYKAIDKWADLLMDALAKQNELPQGVYLNIRYEDLVRDRRATLRRVTDFLGIDFDESILSEEIREDSLARYKQILDARTRDYAVSRHGRLLTQWGYEV